MIKEQRRNASWENEMSKYLQKIEDFQEKYLENCMKTAMEMTINESCNKLREIMKDTCDNLDTLDTALSMIDSWEEKTVKEIEKIDLAKELA
jgi:esterase/lipase